MSDKPEILAFYGDDRTAAWNKASDLAAQIVDSHAEWKLSVRAENQHGEWVVALYREERQAK
jgi:hypothetical protein